MQLLQRNLPSLEGGQTRADPAAPTAEPVSRAGRQENAIAGEAAPGRHLVTAELFGRRVTGEICGHSLRVS